MEYLLYFPLGTTWELAFFIALIGGWYVSDYVINSKPKRSKRTERQIFDEPLEVKCMLARVIANDQFKSLRIEDQKKIADLIYDSYNQLS